MYRALIAGVAGRLGHPRLSSDRIRNRTTAVIGVGAVLVILSTIVFDESPVPHTDAGKTPATPTTTPPPVGPSGNWALSFSDEFSQGSVDDSRWSRCYPWGTLDGCTNGANNELQWYEPDNVASDNGVLRLQARNETARGTAGKTFDYTSGMVTTGHEPGRYSDPPKFAFTYGYFEARVSVPAGRGLWPALWLLPVSRTWPPEIDVMEVLGHDTGTAYLTTHFDRSGRPAKKATSVRGTDFADGYHTFGVDWQPGSITWYVDGVERFRTEDPAQVPDVPMYALVNLAVGGDWPGDRDRHTKFPSTYSVDWVRVWQRR